MWQMERDPVSPASLRKVSLLHCQTLRNILTCPSQLERSPDVGEHACVLQGHSGCNWRILTRFSRQLEKNHETSLSQGDEALLHCIAWTAIPCSASNMNRALTSLMELQRVPKKSVTRLEEPRGHHSNKKEPSVLQNNSR